MTLATIQAATILGVHGTPVSVEVSCGDGCPGYRMVGMPDTTIRESRDRVRAALESSGCHWPQQSIVVNLAPTSERKSGSGLDLAIALGILIGSQQLPDDVAAELAEMAMIGELGLDGRLRPVPGVAPMVAALTTSTVLVPPANVAEARIATSGKVRTVASLGELLDVVTGERPWPDADELADEQLQQAAESAPPPDLADVRGQHVARRAIELAAAGSHHLLFVGAPGSGKTMLAQRLPSVLPPLDRQQALDTTLVHSAAGLALPRSGLIDTPPFRAPHHTSSTVALIGGGSAQLRPGEVSLGHNGIVFLDELGEFPRASLEALREPLEEGVIHVARANVRVALPARFLLVAATNPCPCGGGPPGACQCGATAIARYLRRLSGPLADRFDLRVVVHRPSVDDLVGDERGESSASVRQRVVAARLLAVERQGCPNAMLDARALDRVAPLGGDARALLRDELERNRLTGRGYHRIRRVARTVADLRGGDEMVERADVEIALSMRVAIAAAGPGADAQTPSFRLADRRRQRGA